MGLFDILRGGSRRLRTPAPDRLFALSTAYVTLQAGHGIVTTGRAAIVFQPLATADFGRITAEVEELLRGTGAETGTTIATDEDVYGYRWTILTDPDVEDLVVGVNAVGEGLVAGGYGDRVLAAVFPFRDADGRTVHLIYNFKRGRWYPFVPVGEQARDGERELQLRAILGEELPMEPELERWFPLWGAPL